MYSFFLKTKWRLGSLRIVFKNFSFSFFDHDTFLLNHEGSFENSILACNNVLLFLIIFLNIPFIKLTEALILLSFASSAVELTTAKSLKSNINIWVMALNRRKRRWYYCFWLAKSRNCWWKFVGWFQKLNWSGSRYQNNKERAEYCA